MRQRALLAAALMLCSGNAMAQNLKTVEPEAIDARQLLQEAFTNQYGVDSTARIELVIRSHSGQQRRRSFEVASKIIKNRMHSIGRLTHPEHLRGMTILQIEGEDRSHDAFIYLPSLQSVRRVSTAQRGDAFFGTDLSYEDLERRQARDYRVTCRGTDDVDGEASFVVGARPLRPRSYHEVRFWIAAVDRAILRAHFFKRDADEPFRTISAPRAAMVEQRGHTLPTRLIVTNHARGATTEVSFRGLRVNPEIDNRAFSIRTLEQKGRIPGTRQRRDGK
jgi:hypothetical protein